MPAFALLASSEDTFVFHDLRGVYHLSPIRVDQILFGQAALRKAFRPTRKSMLCSNR